MLERASGTVEHFGRVASSGLVSISEGSSDNLEKRHEQMKRDLEEQCRQLEANRKRFEEERRRYAEQAQNLAGGDGL